MHAQFFPCGLDKTFFFWVTWEDHFSESTLSIISNPRFPPPSEEVHHPPRRTARPRSARAFVSIREFPVLLLQYSGLAALRARPGLRILIMAIEARWIYRSRSLVAQVLIFVGERSLGSGRLVGVVNEVGLALRQGAGRIVGSRGRVGEAKLVGRGFGHGGLGDGTGGRSTGGIREHVAVAIVGQHVFGSRRWRKLSVFRILPWAIVRGFFWATTTTTTKVSE
jgi:hypothetical protein